MSKLHTYRTTDSPKGLKETLCVAQAGLAALERERPGYNAGGPLKLHMARLQHLINECDRKRPTGTDGKHGALHTAECGCRPRPRRKWRVLISRWWRSLP